MSRDKLYNGFLNALRYILNIILIVALVVLFTYPLGYFLKGELPVGDNTIGNVIFIVSYVAILMVFYYAYMKTRK